MDLIRFIDLVEGIIDLLLLGLAISVLLLLVVLLARGGQVFRCGLIQITDTLSLMSSG